MKGYLLDTCVLVELLKLVPSPQVLGWISSVREDELFLSALTVGELTRGVERLGEDSERRGRISWIEDDLVQRFKGRILEVDAQAARTWGIVGAIIESLGIRPRAIDLLIAAQALTRGLTLVTRFEADFAGSGIEILNPWALEESRT